MDDQASNYNQYNNLCMGGGLKLQWNRYNTYVNNILVKNADVEITGVWAQSNHYMTRNIFTNGQTYWCNFFNGANIPNTIKANTKLIDSNCIASNGAVNTEQGGVSWATWRAAGLDVHSVMGDPMFTDVNKTTWATWANRTDGFVYAPVGDYSVRTGSPALGLNFKNFPMDSFGVMPVSGTAVQGPFGNTMKGMSNDKFNVNYSAGRLIVAHDGDYQVTITTALGRTLKVFKGKGNSSFKIKAASLGAGIYFAVIHAKGGVVSQKFVVE
jgi:hypothetical protein